MYLLIIDKKTGVIAEDVVGDNWSGIKAFRDLVSAYKIEALTVVAFTVDYLSPIRNYREKDRFFRALDEVYGNREFLKESDELIINALKKYKELQFHPDIEHNRILNDNKIRLLNKYQESIELEDETEINKWSNQLSKFEETLKSHKERFDQTIITQTAVSSKGYVLSRIENDILSRKNSKFVNPDIPITNPNKLNLNSKT